MPTYDYKCSACGHKFEVFEKVHEKDVRPCPRCGKKKAERQIGTGAGVIFKGAGFHATDYKRAGTSPEPEKKKTTRKETKADKASDTKSDKEAKK